MQKRAFYIIGHNPNTLKEANAFLEQGANALEPDIVFAEGKYYVTHQQHISYKGVITVQEYLHGLKALLHEKHYPLALLIWDIKTTDFHPNDFMGLVKENFSGDLCDGVAMLMTHADDHNFVNKYKGYYANVGVGVDESNLSPQELQQLFISGGQPNFSYADGITTFLDKPGIFKNVSEALQLRDQPGNGFSLVYTWVLSQQASMRKYLDSYIDGIFVEVNGIPKLKELLQTAPYSEVYTLAENGYNPFTAPPVPKYTLTVTTKDKLLAGTDCQLVFTLNGASGESLSSLPFHATAPGAMERGETTKLAIYGKNVGDIASLTVVPLTAGIGAAWLPEKIVVESSLLPQPLEFVFNTDTTEEWVSKKKGAVTRFPV
ncbi:MAG TPA: PLAT/LH2 domain-containing protein [Chitinophagaceae bacterium]|nr:PLAT/LH2 domain-containing protein [Chitinophagaceae bacterium]